MVLITEPADSPTMECRLQTVSIYNALFYERHTQNSNVGNVLTLLSFDLLVYNYYVRKFPGCAPAPHGTIPFS